MERSLEIQYIAKTNSMARHQWPSVVCYWQLLPPAPITSLATLMKNNCEPMDLIGLGLGMTIEQRLSSCPRTGAQVSPNDLRGESQH